jgi:hypothetical protein
MTNKNSRVLSTELSRHIDCQRRQISSRHDVAARSYQKKNPKKEAFSFFSQILCNQEKKENQINEQGKSHELIL